METKTIRNPIHVADVLLMLAVAANDHNKALTYSHYMDTLTDVGDRIRVVDNYWLPIVRELRREKKIPTMYMISELAEAMVDLSDNELVDALAFFYNEIKITNTLALCLEKKRDEMEELMFYEWAGIGVINVD